MKEIQVAASIDQLNTVIDFVDEQMQVLGCPESILSEIHMALDEIFSNIALYAYPDGSGNVIVQVEPINASHSIRITFIDSGQPFDPLQKNDPDVSVPAMERQAGGMGIFLVKMLVDTVEYAYRDNRNILSLTKRLDEDDPDDDTVIHDKPAAAVI